MAIQSEALAAAVRNLHGKGSALAAQDAVAASMTTGLPPAAGDEVSALMATQFATHGEMYQAVSAQARAMHDMFVSILRAGAAAPAADS